MAGHPIFASFSFRTAGGTNGVLSGGLIFGNDTAEPISGAARILAVSSKAVANYVPCLCGFGLGPAFRITRNVAIAMKNASRLDNRDRRSFDGPIACAISGKARDHSCAIGIAGSNLPMIILARDNNKARG